MGTRGKWDDLGKTPSSRRYKQRLINQGITREYFDSGGDLSKARGHAHTPEHPHEAARKPERYAGYIERNPNVRRTMHAFVQRDEPVDTEDEDDAEPRDEFRIVAHAQWRTADKSTIAHHWNAIRRYVRSRSLGDFERQLGPFRGVTIGGNRGVPIYELETDQDVIDRFLNVQNSPPFEDIYDEPE